MKAHETQGLVIYALRGEMTCSGIIRGRAYFITWSPVMEILTMILATQALLAR